MTAAAAAAQAVESLQSPSPGPARCWRIGVAARHCIAKPNTIAYNGPRVPAVRSDLL